MVPGVFGSIMLEYKDLRWFPFHIFSPFSEINHFLNKSAFFRWLHVVLGDFGSFMSSYCMESSWFPFSDLYPTWGNKPFLEQNRIF